jgi:hypothetical protein
VDLKPWVGPIGKAQGILLHLKTGQKIETAVRKRKEKKGKEVRIGAETTSIGGKVVKVVPKGKRLKYGVSPAHKRFRVRPLPFNMMLKSKTFLQRHPKWIFPEEKSKCHHQRWLHYHCPN